MQEGGAIMKRILIVEEEMNLQKLYLSELEQEGYLVEATSGGDRTIDTLKELSPQLVVLNLKSPDLSGLRVLEQIKSYDEHLPVILNSAYTTYKHNFSNWIADAYIVKSVDLEELKGRIRELLSC
jgi:two-component system response regulator (stage 0 sporulation protein F)